MRERQLKQPNVVLVVFDDLGFADLGCFGSGIATPNVDRLAEEGLRYNNFHVTAICSASRACLLTGRNHHAVGMASCAHEAYRSPGHTTRIPNTASTLPRTLRDAGYNTFAVGKWHLAPAADLTPAGPFDRWPLGMGFERYYGFLAGMTSQWAPDLVRDNGFTEPPASPEDGYHLTEDLTGEAIRFVQDQQQAAPNKPFFLYFATAAMHWPHQVPAAWIEPFRGRFDDGWEAWRQRRFENQLRIGLIPAEASLTERPPWVQEWGTLPGVERALYARMMEVYAGFLAHTDAQLGRLLIALEALGALDNTLIVLVSDNGASADGGPHGRITGRNDLATMLERVDDLGGVRATDNHYAWGWAWAGNTPFKLWKNYTWLGGVRVPMIVRWPGGIPASSNGEVRGQFSHAVDVMPTVLDAAGVDAPSVVDGVTQQPLNGASLLATFTDADRPAPRDTQYFEMEGSRAIYHDGWKATTNHVHSYDKLLEGSRELDADRWSLYDTTADFSEARDLAAAQPERLRRMVELWWYEAGRNQVLPLAGGHSHADLLALPDQRRRLYVGRPGGGPIDAPSPLAGFQLTAELEIQDGPAASGIVCAQHNAVFGITRPGGWACYMIDGRPVIAANLDDKVRRATADRPLAPGRHTLAVTYSTSANGPARMSVRVDAAEVAVVDVPVPRASLTTERSRLWIGRDAGVPLSEDYRPPFVFTGTIHAVVLDVTSEPTAR